MGKKYIKVQWVKSTLNFEILLDKLAHYGVLGKTDSLIRSYLTNRKQIVVYENTLSIALIVKSGVPLDPYLCIFNSPCYSSPCYSLFI